MIILKDKKYIKSAFANEAEIERVIIDNYEYLFGPSSVLLEKALIKTADGAGTIPDAFAVDFDKKRWYLVEAELLNHSVWNHISPQVTKQILASNEADTKRKIEDLIIEKIQNDNSAKEKITELGYKEIDFRKHISDILNTVPIVGIPIDGISSDLRNWASTLKNPVKLWIITKYIDFSNPKTIAYEFPEEYKPEFDTSIIDAQTTKIKDDDELRTISRSDITIKDIMNAGKLMVGQKLICEYKPRIGNKIKVIAELTEDGSFNIDGEIFASPSFAALFVLQKAGSDRQSVNGWTSWKTENGKYINEFREEI